MRETDQGQKAEPLVAMTHGSEQEARHTQMIELASQMMLLVLKGADPKVIGAKNWWRRAKEALELALNSSENMTQVISAMSKYLQVEQIHPIQYKALSLIGEQVRQLGFSEWRQACSECCLMVTAQARVLRDEQKMGNQGADVAPWDQDN